MITTKEIDAVELSVTKRDFYQIWNELIDTASKLSNRWDPSSTNESDPGIVLLKVLTAIADKLNYTIDKNTLEAFMPSATQEESMRKLCDMLGYTMKYYQSATTSVNISYVGTDYDIESDGAIIVIPQFTNIKNEDEDLNYVTLEQATLSGSISSISIDAIEGEYVQYDNITKEQLDDNRRYYLPESQIAENGIFLFDSTNSALKYEKVNNLNTQVLGTKCWKFGYDSRKDMPYIEFPSDINNIIGNGISFGFIRTNGANGNISAATLTKMSASGITMSLSSGDVDCEDDWFSVTNPLAAMNGADKESLDDAYTNYKKTIGTFDTLITCRDYMNKIYLLTEGDISGSASTTPLVSNIIASDIRDDINKAVTICSFTENGITYENAPVKKDGNDLISHFDLVLYPFTPYVGINSRADFKNSFKYTNKNVSKIKSGINENKTISHNIVLPENKDLACVKNYIKVKAKITTTKKVNSVEEKSILKNVYAALYKKFNMRKLEFGEQITDEMISEAIESADSRIKNVWVTTENEIRFAQVDGTELKAADSADSDSNNTYHNTCLQLATLNVLAGRVPLFNYDTKFKPSLDEKKNNEYENVFYPINPASVAEYITKIVTSYEPDLPGEAELTLNDNEVIQFRKPNFKTTTTYPAYVNYFIKLNSKGDTEAKAATFMTLQDFFGGTNDYICELVNGGQVDLTKIIAAEGDTISSLESKYAFVLAKDPETGKYGRAQSLTAGAEYYTVKFNPSLTPATLIQVNEFVKTKLEEQTKRSTQNNCLYKTASADLSRVPGYLVDSNHIKYILSTQAIIDSSCTLDLEYRVWGSMYVQDVSQGDTNNYGLGINGNYEGITADQEYELQPGEYLLINYTSTSTDDSGTESSTVVNKVYPAGTYIRPNFKLIDSATSHSSEGVSYSKKTGYNFTGVAEGNPDGLFSLSANEQIEIIEPVVVDLGPGETSKSSIVNVYWVRNDDSVHTNNASKTLTFSWDEDDGMSYTLKENEYFFYTNKNKTDLAYYGNGTKITRSSADVSLVRDMSAEESISADDILQYGLAASIPWITMSLTSAKTIKLYEYQYLNLIKDNILVSVESSSTIAKISSTKWQPIRYFSYKESKDSETKTENEVKLDDYTWEMKSCLQLNIGPALTQTLHESDSITIYSTAQLDANGNPTASSDDDWSPIASFSDVSLKSNILLQTAASQTLLNANYKCQFKAFTQAVEDTEQKIDGIPIAFNNFKDGITRVSLKENDSFKLFISLPANAFGVMMFYKKGTAGNNTIALSADGTLTQLNSESSTGVSTLEMSADGIYIIQIDNESTFINIQTSGDGTSNLFFSNLDIIPTNAPLNPQLGLTNDNDYKDVLSKIKEYDSSNKFYYNYITDSSTLINFNDDDSTETLMTSDIWYDYNNVCNKWVISELYAGEEDESEFNKGIMIDKSSKL